MKTGYNILPVLILLLFITLTGCTASAHDNSPASAAEPVILTDSQGEYPLGLHLEILEDPTGRLTIAQVSSAEYAASFKPSHVDMPNFGLTNSAYWVRFRLRNEAPQTTEWRLVLEDPRIGYTDFYFPTPGSAGYSLKQAGRFLPFTAREVADRRDVFKVFLPVGVEQTLYLRLQSHSPLWIPLTFYSLAAFSQSAQNDALILGLFYGAMLLMMGYNLFLFFTLQDRSYLYLVLFWISYLINRGSWDGLSNQYLWPEWRNLYGLELSATLSLIVGLQFTRTFLSTQTQIPRLDKIMVGCIIAASLSLVLIPLSNGLINRLTPFLIILAVALIVSAAYAIWRQGYRPARTFLLAWLFFLGVNFLSQLANLNFLSAHFSVLNLSIMGSSVWLLLVSSLALADRITLLKAEAEQANRHLATAERRLAQYLEAIPLGVVVHDTATTPHYLNQFALQIFNHSATPENLDPTTTPRLQESIQRYPLYLAGTTQPYPFERLPAARALQGEKAHAEDIEVVIGEQRVPLEISAAPLFNEQGQVQYAISVFQDISERKQLEKRLVAIYQLGQELTLLHDEIAIVHRVLDTALPTLQAGAAGYGFVDQQTDELVYWFHNTAGSLTSPHLRLPLKGSKGLGVVVIRSGQLIHIADTSQEPRYLSGPGDWVGRSALYAPLKIGQAVTGVLVVESHTPHHFTPADQLLFQTLADQAAVAIENARLFQQVQHYAEELEQRVTDRTAELAQTNLTLQEEIFERQRVEEAYRVLVENSLQGFAIFQDDQIVFVNSKVALDYTGYTMEELKAMSPAQIDALVHPDDRAIVQAQFENRLNHNQPSSNYEFRLIRKDGQIRWLEIFATEAEYQGRPATQAAYIDITERKQAEAEIHRHNKYLNTLHQITLDLLNRREVDDLLQTILTRATELLDAPYGEILLPDGDTLVTHLCTPNQPFVLGDRVSRSEALLSWQAFDTGQAVLWDDYATWSGRRSIYDPVELHATLDIPIMVGQDCLGVIALGRDRPAYTFDSEQVQAGLLLAQLAGLVLDNAHWRLKAEQSAIAAERNRLAQDLHDAVTQTLFSASVIAESLPRLLRQRPAEVRRGLEELCQLTRGALAEMRALLLELRPTALLEKKLGVLLSHLTEAVIGRTRLPITLTVEGDHPLPPEVQVALYYIAQEALHNITKHAGASRAAVNLYLQPDSVELSISDDGRGFNPAAIPPGHLGVGIMRERAEKIGARFQLDSQPGNGTQIHLHWHKPLP